MGRAHPVRPDVGPKRPVVDRSTSQNDVNLHDFPLHAVATRGLSLLGQLSLASFRGRLIEYQLRLGVRAGMSPLPGGR